jgi:DNA-binding MarR family transcriptional regulator
MDYVRQSIEFSLERVFKEITERADLLLPKLVECGRRETWVLLGVEGQQLNQRQIGALLGIHPNVLVKILDGMEEKGFLIRRRRKSDRREQVLHATEKGKAVLQIYTAKRWPILREVFRPLTDKQIQQWEELSALILRDIKGDG